MNLTGTVEPAVLRCFFYMRLPTLGGEFPRKQMAYFSITAITDVTSLIVRRFVNITRYDTYIT